LSFHRQSGLLRKRQSGSSPARRSAISRLSKRVDFWRTRAGFSAAFNLNLLRRINRELGGDFDLEGFAHLARWNGELGRVEMHLVSRKAQDVRIGSDRFRFGAGETIHTESSQKYTVREFRALAVEAGYMPRAAWADAASLYAIYLLDA
jgi:uncharacterized SAM-dependent methyltransferase